MGSLKEANIKNRTYYFYNDIINIETFDSNMLKLDKTHTKILIFTILDMLQLKKLVLVMILIVQIYYICVLAMQMDIMKKKIQINI